MPSSRPDERPSRPDPIPGVSEPGGLPSSPWLDAASIERTLFLWLGTLAFGSIAAHGLLVVTGYLLSGTALYLLVRRLTGSPEAGIVGGIAGAFSSHLLVIARAAPEYVHIWFYVLALWRFIELGVRPSARNSVLAGLAILPAMFWTPYFAQHVLVLTGAAVLTLAVLIGRAEGRSRLPRALLPMIGITGAGAVIYLAPRAPERLLGCPGPGYRRLLPALRESPDLRRARCSSRAGGERCTAPRSWRSSRARCRTQQLHRPDGGGAGGVGGDPGPLGSLRGSETGAGPAGGVPP